MVEIEHKEKPQVPLRSLLRKSQEHLLMEWIKVNNIDEKSIRYDDSLLNGVRVFGDERLTDEKWEIDFTYER